MQSAEFTWRIDNRIEEVISREDLTKQQKRELAESLSIPGIYEVDIKEQIVVRK